MKEFMALRVMINDALSSNRSRGAGCLHLGYALSHQQIKPVYSRSDSKLSLRGNAPHVFLKRHNNIRNTHELGFRGLRISKRRYSHKRIIRSKQLFKFTDIKQEG